MTIQQDPTLTQAEIDLRRAEEAIERATKERDEIAAYIRRHKMYAGVVNGEHKPRKALKDETLIEALEAVFTASNTAMLVPEIVTALKARGRKMNSVNPMATVSSILSRSEQFQYEKGRGWTFQSP